ncbi:adenylate cyclase type 9 isoform X1 [Mustela nigripes]|uniref:adenylate cyclase type 9 isoform X1 n=2 Tax=Mustela nigripes TaxID=77151 RepID=UPI002815864A|nr:adenylate cyclase type 9 isoform X1 [Mustela nigripes]
MVPPQVDRPGRRRAHRWSSWPSGACACVGIGARVTQVVFADRYQSPRPGRFGALGNMASPPHQQLLPHHSTEVSCDSSGDSNSVRVKINPKQLSSNSHPKHCKYSISSSCSSSGDSGGVPRRVGAGGRLRRQKKLPQLFERASSRWWDPKFDSVNLEEACMERCFPQTQRRFRYALFYIGFACLLWSIYFGVHMRSKLMVMVAPALCFLVVCVGFFLFTFTKLYARHYVWTSLVLTLLVFALTLAAQFQVLTPLSGRVDSSNRTLAAKPTDTCLSQVGSFSMCIEVLFLLYTVMHLPLYLSLFLGVVYSVLFETFGYHFRDKDCFPPPGAWAPHWELLSRALLHVCIHAIGVHLFIMSQVRSRSTFLKVGQSIMHGKDLEVEKALKERMIHSVMPRIIADDLMKQGDEESENSVKRHATSSPKNRKKKSSIQKAPIAFRPFKMQQIEEVSILFADIVGFTKMSANKSAHALVGLLNDLFGRFDRLCEETKCEKISTLGDCYYCVAGCPEPRADHAYCCIEMGLGMIRAIEQFCQEKKEMVNMRVGVHTGTVLCGILGMRRFKFDVWSNDVNLANLMEQLGVAGKVHISEATAKYLDDRYEMEDGKVTERLGQSVVADQLKGLKTYLIAGQRAKESHCSCSEALLSGFEVIDGSRVSSGPRGQGTASPGSVSDLAQTVKTFDNVKTCPSCGITFAPKSEAGAEGGAVQNGCQEEHKNSTKAPGAPNSKTQNGLLSPPQEEKLTNSQTSLCEILQEKGRWAGVSLDQSALLPLRFKNIREKTDAHFVDVIKEDSLMKDYFFKPPINQFSLNFLDQELERSYRTSYQEEVIKNSPVKTFASATFSSLLDVFLSTTVFLILSITCFLKYGAASMSPPPAALAVFGAALLLEVLSLVVSIRMVFFLEDVMACTKRLLEWIAGWLPRHFIGAILVSLPALAVYSHVTSEFETNIHVTVFMGSAVLITVVHYCNFCQLSSWMRSSLATVVGAGPLLLLCISLCPDSSIVISHLDAGQNFSSEGNPCNSSLPHGGGTASLIGQEVVLVFFLLLLLVWFLNREFEVSYRLHYHGDVEADLHRTKIQSMRDQADWLLRNIIPYHVAEQLKVSQTYSKNHDSGGVIFASIVNFSEFYEENYEGGKECYRVLNELIGDFDELLSRPGYSSIEKIKTIGATYMAASGLNGAQCQDGGHPQEHLQVLFEFAKEMMRVVDDFNSNMLWFNFKLRVGFNHGPLTAGVIGTTKLLYDIWGDTVNIASRMDSTGVECRIQVSEESYRVLSKMGYDFDYRGTVNVKGKGQMKTYLYPKCMDSGAVPQHQLSISPDIRVQVDGSIGRSPTDEIANLVPSVQNADKTSLGSENNMQAKDTHLSSKRPWKEPVKPKERSRFGKAIEKSDCEEVGMEEASELTRLNVSKSV